MSYFQRLNFPVADQSICFACCLSVCDGGEYNSGIVSEIIKLLK